MEAPPVAFGVTEKPKEEENENIYFKYSTIVEPNEENIILNFFYKKPKEFINILDSKLEGDSTKAFIDKCVNVCPIIIFIKTKEGYRFGGFTSKVWLEERLQYDDKCFLFSLDKKEKYKITDPSGATRYGDDYFDFGNPAIEVRNECTSNDSSFVRSSCRFKTLPKNDEINGGKSNFTVDSYEVYKVNF